MNVLRDMNFSKALLLAGCGLLLATASASAEPKGKGKNKVQQARQVLVKIERTRDKLRRLLAEAGLSTREALLASETGDQDSDTDGVSDDLESASGSDLCQPDSDGDGSGDADEFEDDTDPEDPAEGLLKAEGALVALSDTSVTVGELTCVVNGQTQFEGDGEDDLPAGFIVGEMVELKCTLDHTALELERDDADDDDENDSDDDDDHPDKGHGHHGED